MLRVSGSSFDYKPHVKPIYEATFGKLRATDTDQEVKETAINAMGVILANLGDEIGEKELRDALGLLQDRLTNEITRLTTVKVPSPLCTCIYICPCACTSISTSTSASACACGTFADGSTAGVRAHRAVAAEAEPIDRARRRGQRAGDVPPQAEPPAQTVQPRHPGGTSLSLSLSLSDLARPLLTVRPQVIIRNYGKEKGVNVAPVLAELAPLISDADLHIAYLSLQLATTILKAHPDSVATVRDSIYPRTLDLLQSSLLQARLPLKFKNSRPRVTVAGRRAELSAVSVRRTGGNRRQEAQLRVPPRLLPLRCQEVARQAVLQRHRAGTVRYSFYCIFFFFRLMPRSRASP